MRSRSAFVPSASISFAAEALIRRLYSATLFQALDKCVKARALFLFPLSKGGKVFRVFGEGGLDSVVNHVGNRAIRCRGLQAEGAVYIGLKVHGGALRGIHGTNYSVTTLQRQDVESYTLIAYNYAYLKNAQDIENG
jgi:hypothetical protein